MSITDYTFVALCRPWTGRPRCRASLRIEAGPRGAIRVYDEIAGHYTLCHGLSERAQTRLRRLARDRVESFRDDDEGAR